MRRLLSVLAIAVAACSPQITSDAATGNPTLLPSALASVDPSAGAPSPQPSEGALPSPGASPAATGSTATPVPAATPGPIPTDVLLPGSAVRVAVAELNLREGPSTGSRRLEILERGQILIVSPYDGIWFGAGPVKRNGYTWYPVMKLQVAGDGGGLPPLPTRPILVGTEVVIGWIAAGDATSQFVRSLPPRCPAVVNLQNVEAMLAAERLACFGGPIVLEGTFGCPGCGSAIPGNYEPSWLAYPQSLDFLSLDPPDQYGPLSLRFRPGGPARPAAGSIIRVTVHVDDAAASGCSMALLGDDDTLVPVPSSTAVLYCREQLVVDSYEVLGSDPDFGT